MLPRYQSVTEETETDKAGYVCQFLWRDITSNYDILGPYYPSKAGQSSKELHAATMETLEWLQRYGFETLMFTCDGGVTLPSCCASVL